MKRMTTILVMLLLAFSTGCGDDNNSSNNGQNPCPAGQTRNEITGECEGAADAGDPQEDSGQADAGATDTGDQPDTSLPEDTGPQQDASVQQDATIQEDTGSMDADGQDAAQTGGTLYGVVTRKANTQPEEDGVGNLYIAVFDRDPIVNQDSAQLVGFKLIENADLAAADAQVPYRVEGIPPRAEPYFITAFLDDDNTATPGTDAGPDTGDLVAVENLLPPSSPKVTVDSATEVELDLLLNFNMI